MTSEEHEWQTRRDRINKKLKSLVPAWSIIKYKDNLDTSILNCHAVEEYPTANGPADYALFVKGRLLGIIEAKKVSVNPQNVLEQAKRYAKGVFGGPGSWNGYRVPFLYASNGEIIWFIDVRDEKNISRQLSHFHISDALEELFDDDRAKSFENSKATRSRLKDSIISRRKQSRRSNQRWREARGPCWWPWRRGPERPSQPWPSSTGSCCQRPPEEFYSL